MSFPRERHKQLLKHHAETRLLFHFAGEAGKPVCMQTPNRPGSTGTAHLSETAIAPSKLSL